MFEWDEGVVRHVRDLKVDQIIGSARRNQLKVIQPVLATHLCLPRRSEPSSSLSATEQTGTATTSPCLTILFPRASKNSRSPSVNCRSYFLLTLYGFARRARVILFAVGNEGSRCPDGMGRRRIDASWEYRGDKL